MKTITFEDTKETLKSFIENEEKTIAKASAKIKGFKRALESSEEIS